ncbi:MAG: sulfatase [Planctomycetaceae bacterium]|nr:sulfatase [Planctomycetaceae bacterium]
MLWFRICLFVGVVCLATSGAQASPPNVVLIVSDDQAWTDYGFMGHPQIKTPRLDRLARESLVYRRGYVTSSLCCPSLASLITGKYPHQHKIANNDPPGGQKDKEAFAAGRETMSRFMDAQPTLPRLLTQAEYLTLQTGKWWQGDYSRGGFTHGMTKGNRHGDAGLDIGRKTMQPIYDFVAEAGKKDKPFFVWYAPMLPHTPHNPPERLFDKYKSLTKSEHIARYWAMCEFFDETCGQLLDHLEEQKLADNTIVIYVTDNGWIQDPDKPQYAPKSKQSQYDGGLRTPIMVRWPGKIAPKMIDTPISSLDILPTVLDAVGVKRPTDLPGLNLLDESAVAKRETVFGECFTHDSRDLQMPAESLRWRWLVRGDWKLIVPNSHNEPTSIVELFNLKLDPDEKNNVASSEPTRVGALRKELDAWWSGVGGASR